MARGRGCKVGVNLHREQDEYTPANSHGNRTLFVISTWGRAILNQLVDVAGYGIGTLLVEGAKGNPGGSRMAQRMSGTSGAKTDTGQRVQCYIGAT